MYKHSSGIDKTTPMEVSVKQLSHRPLSAKDWYNVGTQTLKFHDDFIFLDYSEKCFRMAAHNLPISKINWYTLFVIRDQLGRDKEAQEAYLFYFKLLSKGDRLEHKIEAMEILQLSEMEFKKIQYLEHNPMDFEPSFFKKI